MRTSRIWLLASAALALGWMPPSDADVVTTIVTTPITVFSGTGTGSVPLASDPGNALGDSINGYGYVNATATISASSTLNSAGTTTIDFDLTTLNVHVSSAFSLNLDLTLVDADDRLGRDFATGSPISLSPVRPLEIAVDGNADVLALLAAFAALPPTPTDAEVLAAIIGAATVTHSVVDAKYALGVDVNGNGTDDVLTLRTGDLDPTLLSLDVTDGDLEALIDAITSGTLTAPIEIEAGVSVTGLSLSFTGDVFDQTADPPFTLNFTGVTLASTQLNGGLPEPSSLLLLLAAGLSLLMVGQRRMSMRRAA
jgi:hypothetical protein